MRFLLRRGLDLSGDTVDRNLPANAGDTGSIPGPGRPHVPGDNSAPVLQKLSQPTKTIEARRENYLGKKRSQCDERPAHRH